MGRYLLDPGRLTKKKGRNYVKREHSVNHHGSAAL